MKKKSTIEDLKKEGVVTTANYIPCPEKSKLNKNHLPEIPQPQSHDVTNLIEGLDIYEKLKIEILLVERKHSWIKAVEVFCEKEGFLPQDLIEAYKTKGKSKKVAKIESNEQTEGKPTKS